MTRLRPVVPKTIRLLLVGGDSTLRDDLRDSLTNEHHAIELEETAAIPEALERVRRDPFNAILLDLTSAAGDTLEPALQLASDLQRPAMVVLTSVDNELLGARACEGGAEDYVVLGAGYQQILRRAIWYAIGRRRAEQERHRAQNLERQLRDVQRDAEAREQAFRVVAHELRAPLAGLRASLELMQSTDPPAGLSTTQLLGEMHREVLGLANLVNDLLDAARLRYGAMRWRWGTIFLEEVCHAALAQVRPLIDPARVALRCSVIPDDLLMRGDAEAVRRLIVNLIDNARKHTAEGWIEVEVAAVPGTPEVQITVRDTGDGIAAARLREIGRPLRTTSGLATSTGGLGLSICHAIAAAHGGTLSLRSRPGLGTAAVVRLRSDLHGPDPAPTKEAIAVETAEA